MHSDSSLSGREDANCATFHRSKLSNGLQLIGESNRLSRSAAIGFFVRTGARDELSHEAGVSHFLEHMMFKGTARRSAIEISFELGNLGAQANAFTSEESTVYYAALLPEYFAAGHELLSDMLRPALDQKEFDTEKKVILEEIALYKDKPHFYLFEHALREYYGDHAAGNSVLGSTDSVGAVTRDQMKSYFDRSYAAEKIVLVASGNFDWNQFERDAERYAGGWRSGGTKREVKLFRPPELRKDFVKNGINQTHIALLTEAPAAQNNERVALAVLSAMVGDSSGSRFYWELVNNGMCETASVECDERDGTGVMIAFASCDPERSDQVATVMRSILGKPLKFSEFDLERAKTKLCSRVVLGGELPLGRLMALGMEWIYRERPHSLVAAIDEIRGVTRTSIEAALERFPLKRWSEFRLVPG